VRYKVTYNAAKGSEIENLGVIHGLKIENLGLDCHALAIQLILGRKH